MRTDKDSLYSQLHLFVGLISRQHEYIGKRRRLVYVGPMDLVLKEGNTFESVAWPTWRGRGYRKMKKRACFKNAYESMHVHDELIYVEGFASCQGFPIHHAWLATPDGRVVDPTWRGPLAEEWEYIGVPFERDFVLEELDRRPTYGLLDEHFEYAKPLKRVIAVAEPWCGIPRPERWR